MEQELGKHVIIDAKECNEEYLDNKRKIKKIIKECAQIYNLHIMGFKFHKFKPIGLSGFAILAESHIAIHTWPEYKFVSVDVFTCGNNMNTEKVAKYIVKKLNGKIAQEVKLDRGF
jgi:S-adenosylmethionine decarboxylase